MFESWTDENRGSKLQEIPRLEAAADAWTVYEAGTDGDGTVAAMAAVKPLKLGRGIEAGTGLKEECNRTTDESYDGFTFHAMANAARVGAQRLAIVLAYLRRGHAYVATMETWAASHQRSPRLAGVLAGEKHKRVSVSGHHRRAPYRRRSCGGNKKRRADDSPRQGPAVRQTDLDLRLPRAMEDEDEFGYYCVTVDLRVEKDADLKTGHGGAIRVRVGLFGFLTQISGPQNPYEKLLGHYLNWRLEDDGDYLKEEEEEDEEEEKDEDPIPTTPTTSVRSTRRIIGTIVETELGLRGMSVWKEARIPGACVELLWAFRFHGWGSIRIKGCLGFSFERRDLADAGVLFSSLRRRSISTSRKKSGVARTTGTNFGSKARDTPGKVSMQPKCCGQDSSTAVPFGMRHLQTTRNDPSFDDLIGQDAPTDLREGTHDLVETTDLREMGICATRVVFVVPEMSSCCRRCLSKAKRVMFLEESGSKVEKGGNGPKVKPATAMRCSDVRPKSSRFDDGLLVDDSISPDNLKAVMLAPPSRRDLESSNLRHGRQLRFRLDFMVGGSPPDLTPTSTTQRYAFDSPAKLKVDDITMIVMGDERKEAVPRTVLFTYAGDTVKTPVIRRP
ncbi:uncharacterized protein EV422DRAFT_580860 [Fimicolochytrium jonesii]|uniref:uncharacterized protein n=1 Tax=Fimicolochytrium jonesii TaxID=1396493 RepID=UPI0022FE9ADF|nr:uncharacterized protein EV422DRAFT_580860 [Fimicolochytrium jonesii]KAI8817286.1 hypothetical protein EV422DRAFT_580860 [Fimicolochytrium jonesii]